MEDDIKKEQGWFLDDSEVEDPYPPKEDEE